MTAHSSFWSEARWGREYGWRPPAWESNPYDLGYHIAQDIMGGSWTGPVPTLRSGEVVATGRSSKIGGFVVIRADEDGLNDTYCHLYTASMPRIGLRRNAGDDLPRLARSRRIGDGHEYMGSASTGPHCHYAVTVSRDGAYNPKRGNDRDPRPTIRRALAGRAAAVESRPFQPEEAQDDMYDGEAEKRLMAKLDEVARVAAPYRIFQWGTGHLCVNPRNGKFWILPQGYGELLTHLGYRAGDVKSLGDGELGFVTGFFPDAVGDDDYDAVEASRMSASNLQAIQTAIDESRVALSEDQYARLLSQVAEGARTGGEAGARAAINSLTFVVKPV